VFIHTHAEVDDPAVPDALARRALDDARADGSRRVLPVCPYVTWWINQHPRYAALLYDPSTT
jgi:predicted GNAT family acetyltransferase